MHFLKGDEIAGIAVEDARALVGIFGMTPLGTDVIADLAGLDVASTQTRLERLESAGYVEKLAQGSVGGWTTTALGVALSKATLRKAIKRATAQRLVDRAAVRARQYNAEPRFLYTIERLRVFGSFLDPEKERLGDVDIEVTLGARPSSEAARTYTRRFAPHVSSPVELRFWPKHELLRFLADGARSFDFQDAEEGTLDTPMQVIYDRTVDEGALERP